MPPLRELPDRPENAAPLLACGGIAAVVALGTSPLAVRIGSLPPGIETADPIASLTFVRGTGSWSTRGRASSPGPRARAS